MEKGFNIQIEAPQIAIIKFRLVGMAPLITDSFPDSARRNIRLAGESGHRVFSRPTHPINAFCGAIYCRKNDKPVVYEIDTPYISERTGHPQHFSIEASVGIPTLAFKSALVTVVRDFAVAKGWKISEDRVARCVRFVGEYAPFNFAKLEMIEVPTPTGDRAKGTVLKWMPKFWGWSTELICMFPPDLVDPDSLMNLIEYAGFLSGVGKMRPSSSIGGSLGTFRIDRAAGTASVGLETVSEVEILNEAAPHGAILLTPKVLKETSVVAALTKKQKEEAKVEGVKETSDAEEVPGDAGGEVPEGEGAGDREDDRPVEEAVEEAGAAAQPARRRRGSKAK